MKALYSENELYKTGEEISYKGDANVAKFSEPETSQLALAES